MYTILLWCCRTVMNNKTHKYNNTHIFHKILGYARADSI